VIVAFDETPQTTTALVNATSYLSWFLPLIASHGLLPLHWSGFLLSAPQIDKSLLTGFFPGEGPAYGSARPQSCRL